MAVLDIQDAISLLDQREPRQAARILERLVDELPAYAAAHILLARSYEALEEWDHALASWRKVHQIIPNSPVIQEGLERCAERQAARRRHEPIGPERSDVGEAEAMGGEGRAGEREKIIWPGPAQPKSGAANSGSSALDFGSTPSSGPGGEGGASSAQGRELPASQSQREVKSPAVRPKHEPEATAWSASSSEPSAPLRAQDVPPPMHLPPDADEVSGQSMDDFGVSHAEPEAPREFPDAGNETTDEVPEETRGRHDAPHAPHLEAGRSGEPLDETKNKVADDTQNASPDTHDASRDPHDTSDVLQELHDAPDTETPRYEDLDRLITELESARIVPRPDFESLPAPDLDDDIEDVVSETLARIYASQGQYDEAARVYELLAGQHPEDAEDYLQKASEMRSRASDGF